MGTLTESFGNLSDYLLAESRQADRRHSEGELLLRHLFRPMLPSAMRCGPGTVTDIKDRQVGPFDLVACIDRFPPFSEGAATTFLADGVVFALQSRDWSVADLTQFGEAAHQLKKMERKNPGSIPCLAVSFQPLPLAELSQFLSGKAGQSVDGVMCIGHHVILRNASGLYGDPLRVPFVTEQPGPEALKAFMFYLLELSHAALRLPFGLADYQHL
jgi:hypothetical protein